MFIHSHEIETLEQASKLAKDIKPILCFLQNVESSRKPQSNLAPNTYTNRDPKGKSVIGESSRNAKGSQCFKCQCYDHVAAQYPSRNLLIKKINDDEIETIVREATGSATNSNDDVRAASIHLGVIRCAHTSASNENWRKSIVFYTYITHEGNNYKLMINVSSCANNIIKTALEKMSLKTEPHSYPYNVNWVDEQLNLLLSVVRFLSTRLFVRIMFGVRS